MSAKIEMEGRAAAHNRAGSDEVASQPPNSYMTEQTIDVIPFSKQNKNAHNVTQNFFMSSKRSAENPVQPKKISVKKHSLQE